MSDRQNNQDDGVGDTFVKHYSKGIREIVDVIRQGREPTNDDLIAIWKRSLIRVYAELGYQEELDFVETAPREELLGRYQPEHFPSFVLFESLWIEAMQKALGSPDPTPPKG